MNNPESQSTDRREFLLQAASMLGVTLCGSLLSSALTGCADDVIKPASAPSVSGLEIDLNEETVLQSVGGALRKTFGTFNGGRNIVIIRQSPVEFLVVTAVCTHQSCDVNLPTAPGANLVCPCHGAEYSSKLADGGTVLAGPAPLPLKKYPYIFDERRNVLIINPSSTPNTEEPTAEVQVDISKESGLQQTGGAIKINLAPYNEGRDFIIVRQSPTAFLVVSSVCNHQGCSINLPTQPGKNFVCPCHGAEYSSVDGTWQPSPQSASDLRVYKNAFDPATNRLTINIA